MGGGRGARRRAGARPRRRAVAPAVRGRRLCRLLLLARARDEPRPSLPPRRRAAAAQLAPPARRLPRPGRHGGPERDADRAPERPGQAAGCRRAPLRPDPPPRHRARARRRDRAPEPARRAGPGRARARPRLRARARQRLERARHPGLGVRAARPVPRQVVRDLDRPLGRAARRVPARAGAAPGADAAALPARAAVGIRHPARGRAQRPRRRPQQRHAPVLERRAADRPPHGQRRRAAHGGPARVGDRSRGPTARRAGP